MKSVICEAYGPPSELKVAEMTPAPLAPDCVRVRVAAAGINFPDTLIIKGGYQLRPDFPFAPGFEVAGSIVECGADVRDLAPGDYVVGLTAAGYGGFAEYADVRAAEAVSVPDSIDEITAAAIYTAYGTAYHALVQRGGVKAGDWVVVLGATGGVGLAAVDIASALGAEVVAVGSSEEKLALASKAGASATLVYREGQLSADVRAATGGAADICIDLVGGSAFTEMTRAMAWEGRLLVIGFTSGEIPSLAVNLLLLKGFSAVGVYWGRFAERDPEGNARNFAHLWELLASRQIAPHIHRVLPMERAAEALDELLARKVAGKLVLAPFGT